MNKKVLKFSAILLLITAIVLMAQYAFSKFRDSFNGDAEGQVAKWSFKVNGSTDEVQTFNLVETMDENSTVTEGMIAPGTSGSFNLEVDTTTTETDLTYTIEIELENKPENMRFYADSEYKKEYPVIDNKITINDNILLEDNEPIRNTTIYWNWELLTGNTEEEFLENDEIDSESMGKTIIANATVTGVQLEPVSKEVSFTVYDYLENEDEEGYSFYGTRTITGLTETEVTLTKVATKITNASYGFGRLTPDGEQVDNISLAEDGSTVVYLYYQLDDYKIAYDLQDGSLKTSEYNPLSYNKNTKTFTLHNPTKDGYIFLGWTGGVVDENGNIDDTAKPGATPNVTNPTEILTIAKGSFGNRKYTANWRGIGYIVNVHHFLAETGPGYDTEAVELAKDELLTSQVLGESYETYDLIPTLDSDGNITETDGREYLNPAELYFVSDSGNTTGVYTENEIHVYYYYQYYPVVRIVSSPATQLNGTEYSTIEKAMQALENAGLNASSEQSSLVLLKDIKDESALIENQNIQLDLAGYTLNSTSQIKPTLELDNAKVVLVDNSDVKTGKVVSKNTVGVYISTDSQFDLGIEDDTINPSPAIEANTKGIETEKTDSAEGIFNFFDGTITATTAIDGTVNLTPLLYSATVTVNENNKQVSTLAIVSGVEARIGRKTYILLEDAIEDANTEINTDGSQVEIVLLKDITKEESIIIDETKNIKLDLDGYTFTTTAASYVLQNDGALEIVDSTATEENPYGNGAITSTTYDTILNNGTLTIKSGTIKVQVGGYSSNYRNAIVNNGTLYIGESLTTLADTSETSTESEIVPYLCSSSTYTVIIRNNGDLLINNVYIQTASVNEARGIENAGNMIINDGIFSTYRLDFMIMENSKAGCKTVVNNGTFGNRIYNYSSNVLEINDGTYSKEVFNFGAATNKKLIINGGTFNNKISNESASTVEINGGTFNDQVLNGYYVNYISTMEINGGTFNKNVSVHTLDTLTINGGNFYNQIYNYSTGTVNIDKANMSSGSTIPVYNNGTGTINIYGGTIKSNTNSVYNHSTGTVNIYAGDISTTAYACVFNETTGTINVGNNEDAEVKIDSPIINGQNSYGMYNENGIFNYYDGTIKGLQNQSIFGQVSSIPENVEVNITYENSVEVATLGVPTTPVAQIGETTYLTLQAAIDACPENAETQTEIKMINNDYVTNTNIISNTKNIKLNLNSYTIKSFTANDVIQNNGSLEIIDDSAQGKIISVGESLINNTSNLTIQSGNFYMNGNGKSNNYKKGISNTGSLVVNGGYFTTELNMYTNVIYNDGTGTVTFNNGEIKGERAARGIYSNSTGKVTVNGGTIYAIYGIYNQNTGTVHMIGGTVQGMYTGNYGSGQAIYNEQGTVIIDNGTIKNTSNYGIEMVKGSLTVNNGTFETTNSIGIRVSGAAEATINYVNMNTAGYNISLTNTAGKVIINDGVFVGGSNINNSGNMEIRGGKYTSTSSNGNSVRNNAGGTVIISNVEMTTVAGYSIYNKGTANIINGKYICNYGYSGYGYGIYNYSSSAVLNLGVDDGEVSKEQPSVYGVHYGVYNYNGTFNFYDGILEGAANNSIYGAVADQADGYEIIKTIENNRETAVLDILPIAKIVSTGEEYITIQEAVDACADNTKETIQILRTVLMPATVESIQISENKDIIFDLNGYTISAGNKDTFINNGNLEVIDSSEGQVGSLTNTSYRLFINEGNGNLVLSNSNITTTAATYTENGTSVQCYLARNVGTGTITVNGANITSSYAIDNPSTGEIIVLSGTVNANHESANGINNTSTGKVRVEDGTVYGSGKGIYNYQGEVVINGGTVYGKTGIWNISTGDITVNNGLVYGYYVSGWGTSSGHAIYVEHGTAEINGGIIGNGRPNDVITVANDSSVIINDGEFSSIYSTIEVPSVNAQLKITGGNFTATSSETIDNRGTLEITGGTFTTNYKSTSSEYGVINNYNKATISNCILNGYATGIYNTKTLDFISGIINTTYTDASGIYNDGSDAVLTLGIDDGTVSNDIIQINSTAKGIYSRGTNSVFNYYDGTIIATDPIVAEIANIPDGYSVNISAQDSTKVATLVKNEDVVQIGDVTYDSIQEAVEACGTEETTIKVIKSHGVTSEDIVTISSDKNIILDLNGLTINNYGTMFNNSGSLQIVDNSSEKTGLIDGESRNLIVNTGALEINSNITQNLNNKLIANSEDGAVKISGGNITLNDDNEYYDNICIDSSSSGNIDITGGSIFGNLTYGNASDCYIVKNTGIGNVNIANADISVQPKSQSYSYIVYTNNSDSEHKNKVTISSGNLTQIGTYTGYGIYNVNNTDIDIIGGNINSDTGVYNNTTNGVVTITGGTITGIDNGIYNYRGTVNLIDGEVIATRTSGGNSYAAIENLNGGKLEMSGGKVSAPKVCGITTNATVKITGGIITSEIYGITAAMGTLDILGGEINITGNGNGQYGVSLTGAVVFTLGEKEYPVSTEAPKITSTKYGVNHASTSATFNFYDGIITGNEKAIVGTVDDTPELYTVQITENETVAKLAIEATFNQVAVMNGVYYDSLQQAINAAGTTAATIKLEKDNIMLEGITIAENQNITIDMNGYSISTVVVEIDYAIQNSGTLTIIDTVLTDDNAELISKVRNYTGTGIKNDGTLTIGIDDSTVLANIPTIVGTDYGIENNGVLNIYDGKAEGGIAPIN